jgi:hypothetical protein
MVPLTAGWIEKCAATDAVSTGRSKRIWMSALLLTWVAFRAGEMSTIWGGVSQAVPSSAANPTAMARRSRLAQIAV